MHNNIGLYLFEHQGHIMFKCVMCIPPPTKQNLKIDLKTCQNRKEWHRVLSLWTHTNTTNYGTPPRSLENPSCRCQSSYKNKFINYKTHQETRSAQGIILMCKQCNNDHRTGNSCQHLSTRQVYCTNVQTQHLIIWSSRFNGTSKLNPQMIVLSTKRVL